jgi:hypothetical protein
MEFHFYCVLIQPWVGLISVKLNGVDRRSSNVSDSFTVNLLYKLILVQEIVDWEAIIILIVS